ncbi:MAG TPA: peptide-methionine (S)-S-oxide reductase MsrA [Tepidisphaeraceae bacterium]|nr:peptide-methionine (S)-S-oxide reductase MsrA [Tepidisphaeraceae bacterium]
MISSIFGASCTRAAVDFATFPDPATDEAPAADAAPKKVVLAGGCFWCTEGVFEQIPGIVDVVSGYAGDSREMAVYEKVSNNQTRHAEVIEVTYDPTRITLGKVLKVFFAVAHDPTTLNRQGPDSGTQYRSAIFFADEEQKRIATEYIAQLNAAGVFAGPIVTTLEPLAEFFPAEQYHQDFVKNNPRQGYVVQQALPKIEKAMKAAAAISATTQPAK